MLIRKLNAAAEMEKASGLTKSGPSKKRLKMLDNPLTVDQVMAVLNCSRSYVYKLLRNGKLEYCDAPGPTKVAASSVLSYMGKRYPFLLKNCYSALDYSLRRAA
mgnify:FL=1